jgi:hypothetical protein
MLVPNVCRGRPSRPHHGLLADGCPVDLRVPGQFMGRPSTHLGKEYIYTYYHDVLIAFEK